MHRFSIGLITDGFKTDRATAIEMALKNPLFSGFFTLHYPFYNVRILFEVAYCIVSRIS